MVESNNTSFLPEDYVQRQIERRTNIVCLGLFVIVLLAVAGAYLVTGAQREQVLQRQAALNAQFEEAARRIDQLDELQAQKRAILRKARVTAALIEPVPRSNLLSALINRMPGALGLLEFELASETIGGGRPVQPPKGSAMANQAKQANGQAAPPAPDVPERRIDLTLIGVAPTDIQVAQYMAALARCPLLNRVDLVYSEEMRREDWTRRRFRVDMTVSPEADVRQIEPLKIRREAAAIAAPLEARAGADGAAPTTAEGD